jgi:hypothetical protein
MKEKELQKILEKIRKNYKWLDTIINFDYEKNDKRYITQKQASLIKDLFQVFDTLNWQLAFNNYKELQYEERPAINKHKCGMPVKVKSCKKEHDNNKTYFGIYIGEIPLSISHSIDDDGVVTAKKTMYNPAIFIPELNDIVYGCESWWGKIKDEEDLKKLITDKVINDVWYVKLLNGLYKKNK